MECSPFSGLGKTPFRYAAWKIACVAGFFLFAFFRAQTPSKREALDTRSAFPCPTALALVADAVFAFRGCPFKEASVVFSDIKRTAEERSCDWSHARLLSTGPERLKLH